MHLTSRNILPLPVAILFEAGNHETLTACKKVDVFVLKVNITVFFDMF